METRLNATNPLVEVDWDDVLETLQEQKCILFLGRSVFQAPGGGDIETALGDWLDHQNPNHPDIQLYNPDGFYLFRKNRFRRRVVRRMKEFYNQPFPETETLFSQIARLPFPMVFTLTPDNLLAQTFDILGLDYQPNFYFLNRRAGELYEKPTKSKPLLYNLLGNIEEPESIILTHGDFFDFLQSAFKGNSMHECLKDDLERMERYIFLGLPYEKWYFQLLLRVLSLHNEKLKEIERLALKEFENPNLHKIYTKEFKIEFFPVKVEQFISELYRRCSDRGLVKPLPKIDPSEAQIPDATQAEWKEKVANGKIDEVMQSLKVFLNRRKPQTYQLTNKLVVLRNRHYLLRQRENRDTIAERDARIEHNQIVEQMLVLVDKAENYR